jgi:pilus assembly protein CpaD
MDKTRLFRRSAASLAICLFLAPMLSATPASAAPAAARKPERGVESAHQPVVARTDFVFDVAADGNGTLGSTEQARLAAWFSALGLRYGDHVSVAGAGYGTQALNESIANVVGRYGLLVEGDAPATAGDPPAGGVRVVVSRSVASVPSCPSWRDRSETDFVGGLSDNYGCGISSNLAAMVADPRDLVEGRQPGVDQIGVVSSKAIKSYQDKAPTGAGALKAESAGGN